MPRTISVAMQGHLAGQATTLAACWKVKRTDGVIQGFTSNVVNINFDLGDGDGAIIYKAATGIAPSSVKTSTGSQVDNNNIIGIINSPDIVDTDIQKGVYDQAKVTEFLVNYNDLTMGAIILMSGYVGQVEIGSTQFDAEVRSLSQLAQQQVGLVCTPTCQNLLGDAKCTVNLAPFTFTNSITVVNSSTNFTSFGLGALSKPDNYFALGKLTFTSGVLNGRSYDIKSSVGLTGAIQMFLPFPVNPSPSDTFSIVAGCDKLRTTCITKFNNIVNFHGFPDIPGADALLRIITSS